MTKYKWLYVAKGHYSTTDGEWTVHVLDNGAVYKTHPSRATVDVTGAKADRYVESAQTKFPVRGKKRAEPEREPDEKKEPPKKAATPKKGVTKKQISAAAKKLAKGAGSIIGSTRAFVTEIGEAEERTYAKRKAPAPEKKPKKKPKKKAKKKAKEMPPANGRQTIVRKKKAKKKAKEMPPANGRQTIVRKKKAKPPTRRTVPVPVTDHPLQYLISGGEALPPTRRRATGRRREQTLEEYMGF